jgi:hypothetical protein
MILEWRLFEEFLPLRGIGSGFLEALYRGLAESCSRSIFRRFSSLECGDL